MTQGDVRVLRDSKGQPVRSGLTEWLYREEPRSLQARCAALDCGVPPIKRAAPAAIVDEALAAYDAFNMECLGLAPRSGTTSGSVTNGPPPSRTRGTRAVVTSILAPPAPAGTIIEHLPYTLIGGRGEGFSPEFSAGLLAEEAGLGLSLTAAQRLRCRAMFANKQSRAGTPRQRGRNG